MAFKLYSDSMLDQPVLACDVCGQQIIDVWNDKATGSPSHNGQVTDVTVHHAACVPPAGWGKDLKRHEYDGGQSDRDCRYLEREPSDHRGQRARHRSVSLSGGGIA